MRILLVEDDVMLAEAITRAFEAGATDFISKPVNWALLPRRLEYILRNAAAASITARARGSFICARRKATGSAPAAAAISSMKDSSANTLA